MTALRATRHGRSVDARPEVVYQLVADVTRWPVVFGPTVRVEHIERSPGRERFRIWAVVGEAVASWSSARTLDPAAGRVTFRQEHSTPPIASMSGAWELRARPDGGTDVTLLHEFSVVDDDPAAVSAVEAALDRNSDAELGALARVAEAGPAVDDLVLGFEDVVELPVRRDEAYAFVDAADRWPERLPHVRRVALTERAPGVQDMEMETVTAGGHAHTTRSIRLCDAAAGHIAYKQLQPPGLLLGHSGSWTFAPAGAGTLVTARHLVAIDPDTVAGVLGPDAGLAEARRYVRDALGANSRATLAAAGTRAAGRPA